MRQGPEWRREEMDMRLDSCQRPNQRPVDTRKGLWIVFKLKWKLLQNLEVIDGIISLKCPKGSPWRRDCKGKQGDMLRNYCQA